jgi:hypothetical protein
VLSAVRQNYDTPRGFFEDKRALLIRQYESEGMKEPYMRLSSIRQEIMRSHSYNKDELLKVLRNDMTYDRFIEMKS